MHYFVSFYGNPAECRSDGRTTILNEFAWNQKANMLFIDQPAGAGLSYTSLVSKARKR